VEPPIDIGWERASGQRFPRLAAPIQYEQTIRRSTLLIDPCRGVMLALLRVAFRGENWPKKGMWYRIVEPINST
jgi:hypothetical protein